MRKSKKLKVESTTPRIEIGSPEMLAAFEAGISNYVPTAGGHELEEEGGVTAASLKNLRYLTQEQMCGKARSMELGPNNTVLVRMGPMGMETYVATGFAWGYRGTGPMGLAEFAIEQGWGRDGITIDEILTVLAGAPADFRGELFHK